MRSDVVVLPELLVDHDLGLLGGGKPLGIELTCPLRWYQVLIESRIDLDRLDPITYQPILRRCCDIFRSVVRSNVLRCPLLQQQRVQPLQNRF